MNFEFELNKVKFDDFGEADMDMLYEFVELLESHEDNRDSIPFIFKFIENNFDKDIGSPGPLIHFLELSNDYQEELEKSIIRQPAGITLWMVNRIINSVPELEKSTWISLLESVSINQSVNETLRAEALDFIELHRDET